MSAALSVQGMASVGAAPSDVVMSGGAIAMSLRLRAGIIVAAEHRSGDSERQKDEAG